MCVFVPVWQCVCVPIWQCVYRYSFGSVCNHLAVCVCVCTGLAVCVCLCGCVCLYPFGSVCVCTCLAVLALHVGFAVCSLGHGEGLAKHSLVFNILQHSSPSVGRHGGLIIHLQREKCTRVYREIITPQRDYKHMRDNNHIVRL